MIPDEHLARLDDRLAEFDPIHVDAPTFDVDTTDGCDPTVDRIAAFVTRDHD